MGQVLSQLQFHVAEPLRKLAPLLSVNVLPQLYRFSCHGHGHSFYRAWWLNTVGQLAALLLVVALWYAGRRCRSTADDARPRAQAASAAFFISSVAAT